MLKVVRGIIEQAAKLSNYSVLRALTDAQPLKSSETQENDIEVVGTQVDNTALIFLAYASYLLSQDHVAAKKLQFSDPTVQEFYQSFLHHQFAVLRVFREISSSDTTSAVEISEQIAQAVDLSLQEAGEWLGARLWTYIVVDYSGISSKIYSFVQKETSLEEFVKYIKENGRNSTFYFDYCLTAEEKGKYEEIHPTIVTAETYLNEKEFTLNKDLLTFSQSLKSYLHHESLPGKNNPGINLDEFIEPTVESIVSDTWMSTTEKEKQLAHCRKMVVPHLNFATTMHSSIMEWLDSNKDLINLKLEDSSEHNALVATYIQYIQVTAEEMLVAKGIFFETAFVLECLINKIDHYITQFSSLQREISPVGNAPTNTKPSTPEQAQPFQLKSHIRPIKELRAELKTSSAPQPEAQLRPGSGSGSGSEKENKQEIKVQKTPTSKSSLTSPVLSCRNISL